MQAAANAGPLRSLIWFTGGLLLDRHNRAIPVDVRAVGHLHPLRATFPSHRPGTRAKLALRHAPIKTGKGTTGPEMIRQKRRKRQAQTAQNDTRSTYV